MRRRFNGDIARPGRQLSFDVGASARKADGAAVRDSQARIACNRQIAAEIDRDTSKARLRQRIGRQ